MKINMNAKVKQNNKMNSFKELNVNTAKEWMMNQARKAQDTRKRTTD